ncbi:MAG: hypothetical protein BGO69_05580 [Bacteroidetes bacterium 46-16]|nr:MAG: hypothetical protein BGO69_05580 [Bacteroidetes bacterium 46-16]
MKRQLFMLAAIIISFAACKKDNTQKNEQSSDATNSVSAARSSVTASDAANPLNPYDSMGYWHNEIVAYIQGCRPGIDSPDVITSTQCVLRFYREKKGEDIPASLFETVSQTVDKSSNDMEGLITSCPYEEPVKEALRTLMQMLKQLSDSDSDYATIKASIMAFEERIMQNSQIAEEGKAVILRTTSVARYSVFYWINYNKPQQPQAGAAMKWKTFVKWLAAVTSDIGGAVVSGNVGYAADCSSYAWDLITYSMP